MVQLLKFLICSVTNILLNGKRGRRENRNVCWFESNFISLHSVYKKRGKNMTKEEIEQFKKEHNCNTCTKNVDCKIVRQVDGKLVCIEEE